MNVKDRLIMEDFKKQKESFIKLGNIVHDMLKNAVSSEGILVMGIEHRVKGEKSLEGKLYKNGDWYQKCDDLTALLGARVICYFSDDVDKVGKLVEKMFDIDWENSSDKRALIKEAPWKCSLRIRELSFPTMPQNGLLSLLLSAGKIGSFVILRRVPRQVP